MKTAVDSAKKERYPAYKDSGVEWLGEIPEGWKLLPGFTIVSERNEKNIGLKEKTVLSLSYGSIVIKPEDKLTGLVPESFETYQLVYPNDIVVRPMDLQNDKISLRIGLSFDKGIISNAYLNLRIEESNDYKFFYYFLHAVDITKVIYGLGSGLRQNLSFLDFKRFKFLVPPKVEQTAIASFLDRKTALIDQAIGIKQKQIELLKERRQIVIHKAVTKGLNQDLLDLKIDRIALEERKCLNQNAQVLKIERINSGETNPEILKSCKSRFRQMKESGVEWIGEVPEGWEVKRLKMLAKNIISGPFGSSLIKDEYVNSGYKIYGQEQVIPNDFNIGDYYISETKYKRMLRYEISTGDILISCVGTFGKIALVPCEFKKGIINPRLIKLTPQRNLISPEYMQEALLSQYCFKQFELVSRGGTMGVINIELLSRLIIIVPPQKEQIIILKFLEQWKSKIATAITLKEQEIEKLKEYKATLINSAVTGKIKVS